MGDEEEECKELQTEEIDVLKSIYEGDSAFTMISDTKFQYKMGNTDSTESGWFFNSDSMFSLTYSYIVYVIDIPKYCSASWETAYDNKFYVKPPIFDRLNSLVIYHINIHIMYALFTYLDDFSLNVGHY